MPPEPWGARYRRPSCSVRRRARPRCAPAPRALHRLRVADSGTVAHRPSRRTTGASGLPDRCWGAPVAAHRPRTLRWGPRRAHAALACLRDRRRGCRGCVCRPARCGQCATARGQSCAVAGAILLKRVSCRLRSTRYDTEQKIGHRKFADRPLVLPQRSVCERNESRIGERVVGRQQPAAIGWAQGVTAFDVDGNETVGGLHEKIHLDTASGAPRGAPFCAPRGGPSITFCHALKTGTRAIRNIASSTSSRRTRASARTSSATLRTTRRRSPPSRSAR